MIQLIPTDDIFEIKSLLARDDLYELCAQGSLSFEDWIPDLSSSAWYCLQHNGYIVGIIYLYSEGKDCISFHGGLLKRHRHLQSDIWFKCMIQRLKELMPTVNLITLVNENNIRVRALLTKCNWVDACKCKATNKLVYIEGN